MLVWKLQVLTQKWYLISQVSKTWTRKLSFSVLLEQAHCLICSFRIDNNLFCYTSLLLLQSYLPTPLSLSLYLFHLGFVIKKTDSRKWVLLTKRLRGRKKRTKKIDVKLAKVDVKKSEKNCLGSIAQCSEISLKIILLSTFDILGYENMDALIFKSITSIPILIFKFNY